tara:strand:- start:1179 stop:2075 length:897 start_codon:yes stop_codon:yes gene_type:complete
MFKRDHLLWVIIITILCTVGYLGYERHSLIKEKEKIKESQKKEKENQDKQISHKALMTLNSLRTSRLFGVQLGNNAIKLISGLNNWEPTDEEYLNWFESNGLLKGTKDNLFNNLQFSVPLNDFITSNRENALDWLVLYQNDDFSKYYIEYNPFNKKISAIIGSLKKEYIDFKSCVEDLRPYANVIAEGIKNDNPDENLIIEDRFYHTINGSMNYPIIEFKYKKFRHQLNDMHILSLRGDCSFRNNASSIILESPELKIDLETYRKIFKILNERKELNLKKEFNDKANEKEEKIDKSGL